MDELKLASGRIAHLKKEGSATVAASMTPLALVIGCLRAVIGEDQPHLSRWTTAVLASQASLRVVRTPSLGGNSEDYLTDVSDVCGPVVGCTVSLARVAASVIDWDISIGPLATKAISLIPAAQKSTIKASLDVISRVMLEVLTTRGIYRMGSLQAQNRDNPKVAELLRQAISAAIAAMVSVSVHPVKSRAELSTEIDSMASALGSTREVAARRIANDETKCATKLANSAAISSIGASLLNLKSGHKPHASVPVNQEDDEAQLDIICGL